MCVYIYITGVLILEYQTQIKLPEFYPVYKKGVNANWTTCWGNPRKTIYKVGGRAHLNTTFCNDNLPNLVIPSKNDWKKMQYFGETKI